MTEFEEGFLVGLLVGEGHFGGDGRQPHVVLRMHQRHESMFRWIERALPGGRLYGPYHHGGRDYYQWMARGTYLRDRLLPILRRRLTADIDGHAHDRFQAMCARYPRQLDDSGPQGPRSVPERGDGPRSDTALPGAPDRP